MIKKNKKIILRGIVFLIFIYFAFRLAGFAIQNEAVGDMVTKLGYSGIFITSFFSGFNIVIPVPVVAFVPLFLRSGFDFWATIITITAGMTMGDSVGYAVGKIGRGVVLTEKEGGKWILSKFTYIRSKHGGIIFLLVFLYASLVPLPNELIIIPLGFLGYRFMYLLPLVLAGNFIFNTLTSTGVVKIFGF